MTASAHTGRVIVDGVPLDPTELSLNLDEFRRPYAVANITTAIPDVPTLDRLDPRQSPRVHLTMRQTFGTSEPLSAISADYAGQIIGDVEVAEGGTVSSIAFIAAGTADHDSAPSPGSFNLSVTPGLPSGLQSGDVLLAWAGGWNHHFTGQVSVDPPPGWTVLLGTEGGGYPAASRTTLLGKIAETGESAPTFTVAASTVSVQLAAFRNAQLEVQDLAETRGTGQNIPTPALDVVDDGALVLALGYKQSDWTSVSPPSGFTEIGEPDTTREEGQGITWAYEIQSTPSDISASQFVVTDGTSDGFGSRILSLLPSAIRTSIKSLSAEYAEPYNVGGIRPSTDVRAALWLRNRRVDYAAGTVALEATTPDALLLDYALVSDSELIPVGSTIRDCCNMVLGHVLGTAVQDGITGAETVEGEALPWLPGETAWEYLQSIVGSGGLRLWSDELGLWHLEDPETHTVPGQLNVATENLRGLTDGISRDQGQWAESVVVTYEWTDSNGNTQTRYDVAGPSDATRVLPVRVERPYPGSGLASARLGRAQAMGRILNIEAVSDYDPRPFEAVQVAHPPPPGSPDPGVELLTNPEFETDASDWHAFQFATLGWVDGKATITPPSVDIPTVVVFGRPSTTRPLVTPGVTYRFETSVTMASALNLQIAARWYDTEGSSISDSEGRIAEVWEDPTRLVLEAVAPAGAASVSPHIWMLDIPSDVYVMSVEYFRMHGVVEQDLLAGIVSGVTWSQPADTMTVRTRGFIGIGPNDWLYTPSGIPWIDVMPGISWDEYTRTHAEVGI